LAYGRTSFREKRRLKGTNLKVAKSIRMAIFREKSRPLSEWSGVGEKTEERNQNFDEQKKHDGGGQRLSGGADLPEEGARPGKSFKQSSWDRDTSTTRPSR